MRKVKNDSRYITKETLDEFFVAGKTTVVDKVITGNGASTAFLMTPVSENSINIIIAPHKSVIIEKQKAYTSGSLQTKNRIKFFYQEGTDTNFNDADVLMFVADSFLLYEYELSKINYKLDRVMVDEAHSVEIQSTFRHNLIDFISEVERIAGGERISISTITASPNHFAKVDVQVVNKIIPEQTIHTTNNKKESLKRLSKAVKAGKNVLLCTTDKDIVKTLVTKRDKVVEANYFVGDSMFRSMTQNFIVKHNPDSNLHIVSSRGFEGIDIYGKDFQVFFYENRSQEFQTFMIANLYQAINRCREGAGYIEYCRLDVQNRKALVTEPELDRFLARKDLSITQRQKTEFKKYHQFLIFKNKTDGEGNYLGWTMKKDTVMIGLEKERYQYDLGFAQFQQFLDDRKLTLVDLNEGTDGWKRSRTQRETRVNMLKANEDFIKERDLYGSSFVIKEVISTKEKPANLNVYAKHLQKYLDCKNYDGNRQMTVREYQAMALFTDSKLFDKLVAKVTRQYNQRSIDKYGYKRSAPYRESFKKEGAILLKKLILLFANERVYIPSNWVANRDYNYLTKLGIPEIRIVAEQFSFSVKEIDLKSAFPRILYAMAGLDLPEDFYGKNKENKVKINVALNQIFTADKSGRYGFEYNPSKDTQRYKQKQNLVKKFIGLGFAIEVINVLMEKFFDNPDRGALFHFCSYYEKRIIGMLKEEVTQEHRVNEGVARRHDSLIIFNNADNLAYLNQLEFLGRAGWVKVEVTEAEQEAENLRVLALFGEQSVEKNATSDDEWTDEDDKLVAHWESIGMFGEKLPKKDGFTPPKID